MSRRGRAGWRRCAQRRWLGRLTQTLLAVVAALPLALLAPAGAWAVNSPPKITKNPTNLTVEAGQSASFTATASGTPTPTVQWEVSIDSGASWSAIEGATATTYTIASVAAAENGYQFRATFRNVEGAVTSKAALLTVRQAPIVTKQPLSTTVQEGQNAVFEALATGLPAPTVQWQTSANGGATWSNISGATSTQLVLSAVTSSLSGHEYRAVFKNIVGTTDSEAAILTVQRAPAITKQPGSATVEPEHSAVFEAAASGFPTPTAQWEVSTDGGASWSVLEGATSPQLTIASAQPSESGYEYRAAFSNPAGTATTSAATLTVQAAPAITRDPAATIVAVGETAVFEAAASGDPAPTVQWELSSNGGATWAPIAGATSTQLTIPEATAAESGHKFRAVFTNVAGTATTSAATLTVATSRFSALAWGGNLFRQLGAGSTNTMISVPVETVGLKFVTAVAAGGRHSLALRADGTVQSWGDNEFGQLGYALPAIGETAAEVPGLTGVRQIAAGANHSLALLGNGTVVAWGDNEEGQLGTGSAALQSEVPTPVKGLSGVSAIAAGGDESLALLSNGTVMAWGANQVGQLGTGNIKSSGVPVAVKGLSKVTAVAAGGDFALALLSSGTVEAWGSNQFDQLGPGGGEEELSDLAIPVTGVSGASAVAAGANHALALLGDGTVLGWGEDALGELGNGVIKTRQATPVAVSGLGGVSAISAGGGSSAALLTSGAVMTWGNDHNGQLGNGTSGTVSDVPVQVSGLAKAAAISAGGTHMLAFGEPLPAVTGVSPSTGPVAGGATVTISGANLGGATAVRFGSSEASFTVESATSIVATAPPATAPGTVNVTVVTPGGTSTTVAADRYTYQLPPTITKVSPSTGPVGGGTTITITGSEFTAASAVTIGATAATQYTVVSPTSITATVPPASAGIVDVRVTNSAGTSAIVSKDHYRYAPTVDALEPNAGPVGGGTVVTVTGTGFAPGSTGTTFKFGKVKATGVSCASSTTCTVTAPAQALTGPVDVLATVNKSSSAKKPADVFTYS